MSIVATFTKLDNYGNAKFVAVRDDNKKFDRFIKMANKLKRTYTGYQPLFYNEINNVISLTLSPKEFKKHLQQSNTYEIRFTAVLKQRLSDGSEYVVLSMLKAPIFVRKPKVVKFDLSGFLDCDDSE